MSFTQSAGVYAREVDQSHIVRGTSGSIGAIVIQSNKGLSDKRVLITNNKQFVDAFGQPSNASMQSALAFLESANRLYVVRKIKDATIATRNVADGSAATTLVISAIGGGLYGNAIKFTLAVTPDADVFNLTIFDNAVEVENFLISKIKNKVDGFGKSVYMENTVNGISNLITIKDTTGNVNKPAVVSAAVALSGGANDTGVPANNDIIAGYDLFTVRDEIDISLLINAGWAHSTIKTNLISIAEARKDCFAVLDSTLANTVAAMATEAGTHNSTFGALYAPWLNSYDQYHDTFNLVPPSGFAAGIIARTENVSEVWFAPAGSRRGVVNVAGVEKVFTEGERDILYNAGVNPIQQFFGEGIQIYGQKTLTSTASALDRINVRLLMNTINKSVSQALKPFVFELNDSFVRDNITSIVTNYLEDIRVRRGVFDYSVVCDTSNNTAQVIDQNRLVVDLYVKPSKVAEFIRVNTIITASGVNFN